MDAGALVDRVLDLLEASPPTGVSRRQVRGFRRRLRGRLVSMVSERLARSGNSETFPNSEAAPDHWTPSRRTAANLEAMRVAARGAKNTADRRVLAGYSGWGGLSIARVKGFPEGFPRPEARGLIHEYYTPTAVAEAVAAAVRPLVRTLPRHDGRVHALEPAAGIGRMLRPWTADRALQWHGIEYSELSGRMLQALFPDVDVTIGPFERWVRDHGPALAGKLGLVIANPPYGERGPAKVEDPDRGYRERNAYAYFLRRALDLLDDGGLGVFLVPYGFLTGTAARNRALREVVLRRHHLAAAYRLPSKLFPGANLVTDLLFFRARGGTLERVDDDDTFVLDGHYFEQFPRHILGTEIGRPSSDDDQTKKPRWGYEVQGTFTGLPALQERPICSACVALPAPTAKARKAPAPRRGGVARELAADTAGLSPAVATAAALGVRADTFLAAAAKHSGQAVQLWGELHDALTSWATANGNPWQHLELRQAARSHTSLERFLSAFQRSGALLPGLAHRPTVAVRWGGAKNDIVGQARQLFDETRSLHVASLLAFHSAVGGTLARPAVLDVLLRAGWAVDDTELLPGDVYLTGHLWPRYDRARQRAARGDRQAALQAERLLTAIAPVLFDDIGDVTPRAGWLPLELVQGWLNDTLNAPYSSLSLVRRDGLVQVAGIDYDRITGAAISTSTRWCLGYINHDFTVFRPKTRRDQNIDEVRVQHAAEWCASFRTWLAGDESRKALVEHHYNRQFRGHVTPAWPTAPLQIARWTTGKLQLHGYQAAGARRVLANRGGGLGFDVGLGKTFTACAVLGRARQEGWARRPVILVPNSLVWKWEADIHKVLPDYRIGVIGAQRTVIARGPRKGQHTSVTDTPEERAQKWTRFQAGEFDVIVLTYSALGRTRMNEPAVRAYADKVEAIQREVRLRKRNARSNKKLTERQAAILKEGTAAWVAEQLELPGTWKYDPGVAWDDLGIDLLICDEAQNYKNLYLPEAREGGVPRYMGSGGDGAKRAWQFDFRCAAVRKRTGGTGVVLLSATPAKNSPLEFYNLVQYVDPDAWTRLGIRDPEQFIDRYLRIELRNVVNSRMEVQERGAVTGFKNLHELRDVLFRYWEFKTAEDVGLKLPTPTVRFVEVDLDREQEAKYALYVSNIEAALDGPRGAGGSILGWLARMALVAVHSGLDEGLTWRSVQTAKVSPHSPKFDAAAKAIRKNQTCGHIVFVDNIAAHWWLREVLVKAGVPRKRIALLNAETAKSPADRQRIAAQFNGDVDNAPEYDVVIANAVAYEGIDLQRRTCAIHHLDLPWEPATLQQRNGRGVRQGNLLSAIDITYYFARKSQDGLRFNLIQGKRGWLVELLASQNRETNNPGAQMDLGPEEILLLISRDPAKTAQRLEAVRIQQRQRAIAKVRADAARLLSSINARYRRAETHPDPAVRKQLRGEAKERLADLQRMDTEAWPWGPWAKRVVSTPMLVLPDGAVLYPGLRAQIPAVGGTNLVEFGRIDGTAIGVRRAGGATWSTWSRDEAGKAELKPEHLTRVAWPTDDAEHVRADLQRVLTRTYNEMWTELGWTRAPDEWLTAWWTRVGAEVVGALAGVSSWWSQRQAVPYAVRGELRIGGGAALREGQVLAPTEAGWQEFLKLMHRSELKHAELDRAAGYWFGRSAPRRRTEREGS